LLARAAHLVERERHVPRAGLRDLHGRQHLGDRAGLLDDGRLPDARRHRHGLELLQVGHSIPFP
jgi:hypothetical protein